MDDAATLENFQPRPSLLPVLAAVGELCSGDHQGIFLWGPSGVGKSHLLQAACTASGHEALYLPLADLVEYPPDALLDGCEAASIVAIDELDAVLNQPHWHEALFHLFNRRCDQGLPMLFAAVGAPSSYPQLLPDLRSRLSSFPIFHLPRLDDQELQDVLRFRASRRGLELSGEVVAYILGRAPRSTKALMTLLNTLDREALARRRGITVPLLNELRLLSQDQ